MRVIARIPRLEAAGPDGTNPVAAAPPDDRGRRQSGSRFPIVSTLVLAAFAGASWAAVWWQERARESVTMSEGDGPVGRTADAGALHPDDGSLTR